MSHHEFNAPDLGAQVRKVALLRKMSEDRALLLTASYVESPPRDTPTEPRPAPTAKRFLAEHGVTLAAALLGIIVLGPRKVIWSTARIAAPVLLGRAVRTALAQTRREPH